MPSRFDSDFHRGGHANRVLRGGDSGIHENSIDALLHNDARVGRRTHTSVDDHGDREPLFDGSDRVRIQHSQTGSNRRRQGHHSDGACVFQLERSDEVIVRVRRDAQLGEQRQRRAGAARLPSQLDRPFDVERRVGHLHRRDAD